MACMIVAIHTQAYLNEIVFDCLWPSIRSAVPVFFILSSFFYFKKQTYIKIFVFCCSNVGVDYNYSAKKAQNK